MYGMGCDAGPVIIAAPKDWCWDDWVGEVLFDEMVSAPLRGVVRQVRLDAG